MIPILMHKMCISTMKKWGADRGSDFNQIVKWSQFKSVEGYNCACGRWPFGLKWIYKLCLDSSIYTHIPCKYRSTKAAGPWRPLGTWKPTSRGLDPGVKIKNFCGTKFDASDVHVDNLCLPWCSGQKIWKTGNKLFR
jgi:hypothetical protein